MADERYDVIIIGTGAGGGTLAHRLAATGKRILLLERGGWLPRERDNWDSTAVFVEGQVPGAGVLAATGTARSSRPRSTITSAETRSSTGRRCSAYGPRTSASCATPAGSPRHGRSATTSSSRTTPRPSTCTACTASTARTRPRARPRSSTCTRRCSTSPGSSSCPTIWRSRGCTRSTCRSASTSCRTGTGGDQGEPLHPLRPGRRLPLPGRGEVRRAGGVRRAGAASTRTSS